MIDSFFLWLFIKISRRWFESVIFATDPETQVTRSIFFFTEENHAKRLMEIIDKEKLNHKLVREEPE